MFKTGHALLLPGGRFSRPRIGRETDADQPRYVMRSWPQTRHFRKREQAQDNPLAETGNVRKQSAPAFCPCQQSRSQTVRIHGQATDSIVHEITAAACMNCPQTIHGRETSAPVNWPGPQPIRKRGLAKNNPCHRIALSAWTSACFPVLIQLIPPHEHI